jgi:hypothetical protein
MALMLEAANSSEISVNIYQTTRCNNPKGNNLYTRRRENPKSHVTYQNEMCEHVAPIENMTDTHRILIGKHETKTPLGRLG